jgi:hypothetical protein
MFCIPSSGCPAPFFRFSPSSHSQPPARMLSFLFLSLLIPSSLLFFFSQSSAPEPPLSPPPTPSSDSELF